MFMFSAARCLVPSLYLHPHAVACRRAPAPTAVSAKPRRSSRGSRRERSWDDDGDGGSDSDIDDGFFGQEQDEEEPTPSPGRPASPAPQLRGSDVLRALQRAAAAKENKKKDMKKPPALQRQGKEKPAGGDVEAREVRPVVIRPEWAARIRELELRVQQLAVDK
jgi:hypothetical protein